MSGSLIDHLERYLGPIQGGWREADGVPLGFQIAWFRPPAHEGVVAYATLGLSRHVLQGPAMEAREELVVAVREEFRSDRITSVVADLAQILLQGHRPILFGEVLPPRDPIVPGSSLTSFYAAPPSFLENEFREYRGSNPVTLLLWMIPVSTNEAALIATHGGKWFERSLLDQPSEAFDLRRTDISQSMT
jgi:hypothetical protein